MSAYLALARVALQETLSSWSGFLLGYLGAACSLVAMLSLWQVVFGSSHTIAGFTWDELKSYLAVGFVSSALMTSWIDWAMSDRIHTGEVAMDLLKPIDYQRARCAELCGVAVAELIGAGVVAAAAIILFGGASWPSPTMLALATLSLALVLPLKFALTYLTTLTSFWTTNYLGVRWARIAAFGLFSGAFVPLTFFPRWFSTTAALLPFQATAATPALIFAGHRQGSAALLLVAIQLAWATALWFAARSAWRIAVRKTTIQGG